MWIVISSALSATLAVCCLIATFFVARRAARAAEWLPGKVASLESQLALQQRLTNDLAETLTELANRVKMQRVRNVVQHGSTTALPDPARDPEGWRKAMNRSLAERRIGSAPTT